MLLGKEVCAGFDGHLVFFLCLVRESRLCYLQKIVCVAADRDGAFRCTSLKKLFLFSFVEIHASVILFLVLSIQHLYVFVFIQTFIGNTVGVHNAAQPNMHLFLAI